MAQPQFWLALTKIIWINVLLSGDNALVIALACRGLQPKQRVWGMILGAAVAVLLRIIFTGIIASLMGLPFLKLIGGLALVVIAAKLLVPEDADEDSVQAAHHLWSAVRIVAVADIVMSLDNVIAVAAAANGSVILLVLSLVISVPLIVAGAALIMAVLDRAPVLVWLGAALLGWIAGDVIATDPIVHPFLDRLLGGKIVLDIDANSAIGGFSNHLGFTESLGEFTLALLGVAVVLLLGTVLRRRALKAHKAQVAVVA
ncbi:MAG: TerC family protein [Xanthobacteraceae bacterium]|nr:TerC family protein [Xanthobacteraceae bacterium]